MQQTDLQTRIGKKMFTVAYNCEWCVSYDPYHALSEISNAVMSSATVQPHKKCNTVIFITVAKKQPNAVICPSLQVSEILLMQPRKNAYTLTRHEPPWGGAT